MISQEFARDLVNGLFRGVTGKPPRKKVSKAYYQRDIDMAHRCGEMKVFDELLNKHREEPYEEVDMLIGDIQIMLLECYNDVRNRLKIDVKPTSLETIMTQSGYDMSSPSDPNTSSKETISSGSATK